MISIITRCRNRLEYTAQVLDAVKRRTHVDYEHIIVDNCSSDGTREWFQWMAKNSWYENVRYFRMERNTGDWGGMLAGFEQAKGDYIVQLDNDIIPCDGWLEALGTVLVNTSYKAVMLKRANIKGKWILQPQSEILTVGDYNTCKIERVVACYIMNASDFKLLARTIPESQGLKSKYKIASLIPPLGKILNKTCYELQADDQRVKYNPKNPQIWEKV